MLEQYIADLKRRRTSIQEQIDALVLERDKIDAIIRERQAQIFLANGEVKPTEKNIKKLIIWGLIRQFLKEEHEDRLGKGLKTREIYERLKKDNQYIKYTTLRSYLHRLNKQGHIFQAERSGMWRLKENPANKE